MTAKTIAEFVEAVGHQPEADDMERANCVDAGQPGHYGCGWCEHGKPVFLCVGENGCFSKRARQLPQPGRE